MQVEGLHVNNQYEDIPNVSSDWPVKPRDLRATIVGNMKKIPELIYA